MSDVEKIINASDLIEWIMETYPDWCVGAVRSIVDHVEEMPSAQPNVHDRNVGDTISRKAAIDATWEEPTYTDPINVLTEVRDRLRALPSAPPERKVGKWIKMSDTDGIYWACSECGEDLPRVPHYNPQFDLFPRLKSIEKTKFCPNCGHPMEVGK